MAEETKGAQAPEQEPKAAAPTVVQARHLEEREPQTESEHKRRLAFLRARAGLQLPSLPKDSQGHGYKYASLGEVLSLVDKPLREAGFVWRWTVWQPSSAMVGVRCVLTHVEGWWERSELIGDPVKLMGNAKMSGIHCRGAFLTYAERYTFLSVVGVCADFDSDGAEHVRDDTPPPAQPVRQRSRQGQRYADASDGGGYDPEQGF